MKHLFPFLLLGLTLSSCDKEKNPAKAKDINTAERVAIDRFSSAAGRIFVRNPANGLPAANAPINFDQVPFITKGLTANGAPTEYYNFDMQSPLTPANIYVFFKNGSSTPLPGQNNIISAIPGEGGYNDFWIINKVIVPDNYVPNSVTSVDEVFSTGYLIDKTDKIVNCPVVPFGSVASKKFGGGSHELNLGWYKGKAVAFFSFEEKELTITANGTVPVASIYVMFNDNTGPASGFKTEPGTDQTHNVISVSPSGPGYSPLWIITVISNSSFDNVMDLSTAQSATVLNPNGGIVNCPVVQ